MSQPTLLVPIPWETRNLGLPAFEVPPDALPGLSSVDLADALLEKARLHPVFFAQCRVPKESLGHARRLEERGFRFMESTLSPLCVLGRNKVLLAFLENPRSFLPERFKDRDILVETWPHLTQAQKDQVQGIAGTSFSDDRFHQDPQCRQEIADRRFTYWVEDLTGQPEVIFDALRESGQTVGFMARQKGRLILAGFLPSHIGSGLGEYLWLSSLKRIREEGHAQVQTLISTTNIPVLNLYVRLGFKFKDPSATFHLWHGPEGKPAPDGTVQP